MARMAAKHLSGSLAALDPSEADVEGKLWDAFARANEHLLAAPNVDCALSGATLTLSVIRGSQLTTAWVGDSRAVRSTFSTVAAPATICTC